MNCLVVELLGSSSIPLLPILHMFYEIYVNKNSNRRYTEGNKKWSFRILHDRVHCFTVIFLVEQGND